MSKKFKLKKKVSSLETPLMLEVSYQKKIRKIITRVSDIIRTNIVEYLPTIMAEVNATRPINDEFRYDDNIGQKVAELFTATRAQIDQDISLRELENMVQAEASQINSWQKSRITMVIKQGLGVELFYAEPWLPEALQMFTLNNVNLIKSSNEKFLNDVEETVFRGMQNGTRHEQIAKQILGQNRDELGKVTRFRSAKTRANLIGRDQVNKLNGTLNHLRQQSAGFKNYFWRDVGDGRVRARHVIFGTPGSNRYSWEVGAGSAGVHPGEEIACRCWAEPDFSDVLN